AMTVLATACMAALASQAPGPTTQLEPLYPVSAGGGEVAVDESPQRWFVELTGAPAADGGRIASLRSEKQAFRTNARAARLDFIEHYAFDGLFNGLSISVSRAQLSTLTRIPGVKAIYPVETIAIPERGSANPD